MTLVLAYQFTHYNKAILVRIAFHTGAGGQRNNLVAGAYADTEIMQAAALCSADDVFHTGCVWIAVQVVSPVNVGVEGCKDRKSVV